MSAAAAVEGSQGKGGTGTRERREEMQIAEILSDLVSLRGGVCDPTAALVLVSARPEPFSSTTATETKKEDEDLDLQRAKELVTLHYEVRERCKRGELGRGLVEARGWVERAVGG